MGIDFISISCHVAIAIEASHGTSSTKPLIKLVIKIEKEGKKSHTRPERKCFNKREEKEPSHTIVFLLVFADDQRKFCGIPDLDRYSLITATLLKNVTRVPFILKL